MDDRGGEEAMRRQWKQASLATASMAALHPPFAAAAASSSCIPPCTISVAIASPFLPSFRPLVPLCIRASSSSSSSSSPSSSFSPIQDDPEWYLNEKEIFPPPPDLSDHQWYRSEDDLYLAQDPQVVDQEWYSRQAQDEDWFRKEEQIYEARLAEEAARQARSQEAQHPDYLSLSESSLFAQCRMDTFRASGPGGQHRNKTDSGVRLTHLPTGVVTQAVDDRSQHKNRAVAMSRLRLLIAAKVRRPVKLRGYRPPLELVRLLPLEKGKKSKGDKIGSNHSDYAKGVQSLLDLLFAVDGFVFLAAGILRVSPGALSKVLTSDKVILQATNELLASKGHRPFK